jgi:hypothetical protein
MRTIMSIARAYAPPSLRNHVVTHSAVFSVRLALVLALGLAMAAPAAAQVLPAFGGDRAGTAGFKFLNIPVDPRGAALGETVVSNAFDASSLFWNPALAAQAGQTEVGVARTQYFAGIGVNYLGAIRRVGPFSLGLSLHSLNSGAMEVTTEFQPGGTGQTFAFNDLAVGLTVSQALTDLFSYGVTAKYIHESTAGLNTRTAVFDLGIFYRIGATGAQLGVAIRNFGLDGRPSGTLDRLVLGSGQVSMDEFESITPPTTFLMGITYNVLRDNPQHALTVSGQLTNPNDNAERFNVGAEYTFNNLLAVRAGYQFGLDEASMPSLGVGFVVPGVGPRVRADYGFNNLDRLGTTHRVGINVRL